MADGGGRGCRRSRAWHRAQWRAHVDAWTASGLSGAAYCRRHGLRPKNLYRWRRVLSAQSEEPGEAPSPGALFAELKVASWVSASSASGVEVVLAGERRVRIARGFDAATLSEVVCVLEGLGVAEAHRC